MRNADVSNASHSALRTSVIPHLSTMPEFAYIARDLTGKPRGRYARGGHRARSGGRRSRAAICFRSRWPRPMAARPAPSARRACGRAIMAGTYGQLSALLGSGVPLLRSLEVIREQTPHKNLANGAGRRSLARAGRRDAGRRDGPASAGVRRAGHQHRPRRRRRRLPGRSARSARQIHRAAGRAQEPRHRRAGLPDDPVRRWARSSSTC